MKTKNTGTFITLILLMVVVLLGYYTFLSGRKDNKATPSIKTEKEELLEYNFEENYPKTVRETMKMYCKYIKMAYSGECSDEDLYTLNIQTRQMLDDELLANNTADHQLRAWKNDIMLYEEKKQKLIGYTLEEASQIQYNTEKNTEYAKTTVSLSFKVGMDTGTMEQEYLLRKDDRGRWKILGWQAVSPKETE